VRQQQLKQASTLTKHDIEKMRKVYRSHRGMLEGDTQQQRLLLIVILRIEIVCV
jgi:hypothetical protein